MREHQGLSGLESGFVRTLHLLIEIGLSCVPGLLASAYQLLPSIL